MGEENRLNDFEAMISEVPVWSLLFLRKISCQYLQIDPQPKIYEKCFWGISNNKWFDKAVKKYDDIFMVINLNIGIKIKSIGGSILNIRLTSKTKCF